MSHTARERIDKGKKGGLKRTALETRRQSRIALPLGPHPRGATQTGNGNLALGTLAGAPLARTGGLPDKLPCLLLTPLLEMAGPSEASSFVQPCLEGLGFGWVVDTCTTSRFTFALRSLYVRFTFASLSLRLTLTTSLAPSKDGARSWFANWVKV